MSKVSVFDLYKDMRSEGIDLMEHSLLRSEAVSICSDGAYGIFIDTNKMETLAEELSVVAHEYGHCATGATHVVYSPLDLVEKHEYKANKWAVHRLISINDLHEAFRDGYTEVWNLAEYFDVTEDFIRTALNIYEREGLLPFNNAY